MQLWDITKYFLAPSAIVGLAFFLNWYRLDSIRRADKKEAKEKEAMDKQDKIESEERVAVKDAAAEERREHKKTIEASQEAMIALAKDVVQLKNSVEKFHEIQTMKNKELGDSINRVDSKLDKFTLSFTEYKKEVREDFVNVASMWKR